VNVKNKRRRLAEINTDYKDLMKRIEAAMAKLHAALPDMPVASDRSTSTPTKASVTAASIDGNLSPMAKLDEILPSSPAATAGIADGDLLLKFGDITSSTEQFMSAIVQLVGQRVNQEIGIVVQRGAQTVALTLTPKPWGGRGLLGCHLSSIQK
jgi:26S proteasome non-ATPase regulatory subunit 9